MLAALGLFAFELASAPFDAIDRDEEWRHARTPRVGARDASQYVGPGEDRVRIAGAIVPEAAGSFGSIETLRQMAATGDVHQLVDGAGTVWGGYVIARLSTGRRNLLVDGTPRWIDFTLELDRVS